MKLPKIISEEETLAHVQNGGSLARYGDGELRLALGGSSASQVPNSKLAAELRAILRNPGPCMIGLPNYEKTPRVNWKSYAEPKFASLYNPDITYGSAFITRPDSAPWIDTPEYWDNVRSIWRGRNVTLVIGDKRSLRPEELHDARNLRVVMSVTRNAYADIAKIEAEIGETEDRVILCLGATATVLAWRLALKGIQGIDLGHMGMFMRKSGSYGGDKNNLISDEYRRQNRLLHEAPEGYGGSGKRHASTVLEYARDMKCETVLDYGCGEGTLKRAITGVIGHGLSVREYDPAVVGKDTPPKGADLVVCTDVLEHIEPDKLVHVLAHLRALTGKACYISVATRLANKTLPDGRNAHQIVEQPDWWLPKIREAGFTIDKVVKAPDADPTKQFHAWLRPVEVAK